MFVGDPIYETKARQSMDFLWSKRQRSTELMGTVLKVDSGEWIRFLFLISLTTNSMITKIILNLSFDKIQFV